MSVISSDVSLIFEDDPSTGSSYQGSHHRRTSKRSKGKQKSKSSFRYPEEDSAYALPVFRDAMLHESNIDAASFLDSFSDDSDSHSRMSPSRTASFQKSNRYVPEMETHQESSETEKLAPDEYITKEENEKATSTTASKIGIDELNGLRRWPYIVMLFCILILASILIFLLLPKKETQEQFDAPDDPIPQNTITFKTIGDATIRQGSGNTNDQSLGLATVLEVSQFEGLRLSSRALLAFDMEKLPVPNVFEKSSESGQDMQYTAALKLWAVTNELEDNIVELRILQVEENDSARKRSRILDQSNYDMATGASFSYSIRQTGNLFNLDSSILNSDGSVEVDVTQMVQSSLAGQRDFLLMVEIPAGSNTFGTVSFRSREFNDGSNSPEIIVRLPTSAPTSFPSISSAPSLVPSQSFTPSLIPTSRPSQSDKPSYIPSQIPSLSNRPSQYPTGTPSLIPSKHPSIVPSLTSSGIPTVSVEPSILPTILTDKPSIVETQAPSINQAGQLTDTPTSVEFGEIRTTTPTAGTEIPSDFPSDAPSYLPSMTLSEESTQNQTEVNGTEISTLTQFCVIADVPYTEEEEAMLPNQIVNQTEGCEFLIHLGDIMKGSHKCAEDRYIMLQEMLLNHSDIPVFIVPGDNEWNDCGDQSEIDAGWRNWTNYFLRFEENWQNHSKFNVQRQSTHEENFFFVYKRTLFLGFNIVGGTVHDEEEWQDRLRDQYNWMVQAVRRNIPENADGIIVMAHASPKDGDHRWFFDPLEDFVKDELDDSIPFLYLHGDGHEWKHKVKWKGRKSMLRIQHEGGTREPVLKILADPHASGNNDPTEAFLYDRQLHLSDNIFDNKILV